MKKKLKIPPKPTIEESVKLKRFIRMEDWHFESTIKKNCTEISSEFIYKIKMKEDFHLVYATVFGLKAVKGEEQESCIANIFIRYATRVYQVDDIKDIIEIIHLLKKEDAFEEYSEKIWEQKWEAKKKLMAIKKREKAKVKKLKIVPKRKVA